jgi:hypothetical protein
MWCVPFPDLLLFTGFKGHKNQYILQHQGGSEEVAEEGKSDYIDEGQTS